MLAFILQARKFETKCSCELCIQEVGKSWKGGTREGMQQNFQRGLVHSARCELLQMDLDPSLIWHFLSFPQQLNTQHILNCQVQGNEKMQGDTAASLHINLNHQTIILFLLGGEKHRQSVEIHKFIIQNASLLLCSLSTLCS